MLIYNPEIVFLCVSLQAVAPCVFLGVFVQVRIFSVIVAEF